MDFQDLRIFVAVARTANLSEAARLMGVPKSSASRSIARLEDSLGASLLYRSNRRTLLTEAGTQFLDFAADMLERYETVTDALDALRTSPRGRLRVTTAVNPGQYLIAPILGAFLRRYPDINVDLTLTGEAIEPLSGDLDVDVAIRIGGLRDSSLMARRLGVVDLGLYASPAYLAERGMPRLPADLDRHDLIDIADRGVVWSLTSAQETCDIPVRCRMLVNDTSVIRTVLRSGFGIGWLPTYMGAEEMRDGHLRRVLVDWSRGAREVHAIFAPHRLISPKVRVFIDFLAEQIRFPDPHQ